MKLTTILLLFGITVTFATNSHSQNMRVNIHANNVQAKEIIKQIEDQTDYLFVYNYENVDLTKKVTYHASDTPVSDVLERVFKDSEIVYAMEGTNILLMKKPEFMTPGIQQVGKKVTGIVTDEYGDPIIGANVVQKGTTNGTITDIDGNFSLEGLNESAVLMISYIGYNTQEVTVAGKDYLNIQLQEDVLTVDEVVVVGYGVQRKVTTTGAVTKVEGSELTKLTATNTTKALQGLTPGVTIVDRGGAPGSEDSEIYLRGVGTTGNSSPLVLVDGIEMPLNQVPTHEIENISILKDAASASIYGSRAAHGVILVTTKRGKAGKMKVSYDGFIGFQDRAIKAKAVSAREYMEMVNEASYNAGSAAIYSEEDILLTERGTSPYTHPYRNYPNEVFKGTYLTEHNLSINGGNETGRYMTSFNYLDQPGLTANTNYQRYSYRLNTDVSIGKMLRVSSDLSYRHADRLVPSGLESAQYRAWSMQPTAPIKHENGNYALDSQRLNPIASTDIDVTGKEEFQSDLLYGQVKAELEPIKDLVFSGVVSLNAGWDRTKKHSKNYEFYDANNEYVTQWNAQNGVKDTRNNEYQLTLRFLANYKKTFNKEHAINILYGMEQISYRNYYSVAERRDLISDALPDISLGSASSQYAEGMPVRWGINSYFGRINYGFRDKYLFEANIRADGSSRFASGNKWGVFPSFSAAWRISEEAFMEGNTFFDNLKIRASWGQTGNERIYSKTRDNDRNYQYLYLPQYSVENVVMDGNLVTGVRQSQMANPNITWETVETTNFGLDFSVLNNSIFGEFEYYIRDTKDILLDLAIPNFIGLDPPPQNAGAVRNSGVEAMLGYRKTTGEFKFSTVFNFAYNKNKWVDRGGDNANIDGWTYQGLGSPLNAFYIFKADGLIANDQELAAYKEKYASDPRGIDVLKAGDVKLVDVNGDGTIDSNDRVAYNSNIPKFNFGLTLNAEYKNFDLNLFFQGASGANRFFYGEWYEGPNYEVFTGIHFRDRWTEENQNPNATVPRLEAADNRNMSTYNSFFLKNISYVRLKNVQLGYTIPYKIVNKAYIDRLRVYVSASNLLTFSGMDQGLDPESVSGRFEFFPAVKTINFGVNLTF